MLTDHTQQCVLDIVINVSVFTELTPRGEICDLKRLREDRKDWWIFIAHERSPLLRDEPWPDLISLPKFSPQSFAS